MKIKIIFFLLIFLILPLKKVSSEITDALFMTIGNKAITQSDIVNEIKIFLILNNESYTADKRDQLQKLAINSIIKRKIKEIEIDRNQFYQFNEQDLNNELQRLAININADLETLKNICASNELDFSIIENNIKTDLSWNGLIFEMYKNKLSINTDEIYEQLKFIQDKKTQEYLISEILVPPVPQNEINSRIREIVEKINIEGFDVVAGTISISESSSNKGDLGWLDEDKISTKVRKIIQETKIGTLSKPIILREGILFFKVRDKRNSNNKLTLEEKKENLVSNQKIKILKMYSLSHYDKIRRSIAIKYLR
jgi:parvulin-like peptidyl-prolyl isomerase